MPTGPIRVLELRSVWGTGGGPEKTIMFGAALSDPRQFDVHVCYIRDARDAGFRLDKKAAELGIPYIDVVEKHSLDVGIWSKLKSIVTDKRFHIVHSHDYKTDLIALLLARRTGVIALSTAHGWAGESSREKYFYYPANKWILKYFPKVIAVSETVRDALIRFGCRPERVVVLRNGIDAERYSRVCGRREAVRSSLGIGPEDVVVGAVGRLHPVKRFDLLIEAVEALAGEFPHLRLVIVGDGPLKRTLEEAAGRLGARCLLLGHRDDLVDLYQTFDLFVQSSESEGSPNAVLEAMSMEVPVVATDVGGTREMAAPDVDAVIIPKNDPAALRDAIRSAVMDPAAARARAVTARSHVEQNLSFAARTRHLEGIYRELVANAGDTNDAGGQNSHA